MGRASGHAGGDILPRWAWRGGLTGVALLIAGVAVAALALGLGAADPPVARPVTWQDRAFAWTGGAQQILAAGAATWSTAPERLDPGAAAFTVTVRARWAANTGPLAAWGVWIAEVDGTRILYAISAGGYWTIRACPPGSIPGAVEDCPAANAEWRWRAYPHIHNTDEANSAGAVNTITLHHEPDGAVRLRVNREQLGAPLVVPGGTWGLWARSGTDTAVMTWEQATLAQSH